MTARTYVYTSWKSVYSLLDGWCMDEGPLRKHDASMAPPSAMEVNMWQRHLLRLIGYIRKTKANRTSRWSSGCSQAIPEINKHVLYNDEPSFNV